MKQSQLLNRVKWKGSSPAFYTMDSTSQLNSIFLIKALRKHLLQFSGLDSLTLTLYEFETEDAPYFAFQSQLKNTEVGEGVINKGNQLVFYHSPFIAVATYPHSSLIPTRFLKENLVFEGEDFFKLPSKFGSFPVAGRLGNSERIFKDEFLGQRWSSPIYAVQYFLHGDTITLFRMPPQSNWSVRPFELIKHPRKNFLWRQDVHLKGQDGFSSPVDIWITKTSTFGVAGCYDTLKAVNYGQKLEKMQVLWTNP